MKLEEVLPAMRAGRVAIDCIGNEWSIHNGTLYIQDSEGFCYTEEIPPLVGWTLEHDPKVEWPKGSLGWALSKVPDGSIRTVRLSNGRCLSGKPISVEDALALDWDTF